MKIQISNEILEKYPKVKIGVVIAKDIRIRESDLELEELKRGIENELKSKFTSQTLSQHPFINAWRETYRSFGVTKVKEKNPSAEALIRRVLKEGRLPSINTLVDLYCMISAKNLIPIGGYDLDKVKGNIILRFSKDGEEFLGIGKYDERKQTEPGEVVYADDEKILCRRWNYRDCKQTAITLETKNVCLQVDGTGSIPLEILEKTTEELAQTIKKFCGGEVKSFILDKKTKEVSI